MKREEAGDTARLSDATRCVGATESAQQQEFAGLKLMESQDLKQTEDIPGISRLSASR